MSTEKKKPDKKEMKITLISKPLKTGSTKFDQSVTSKSKPQDKRKKGTKGLSWIGWKTCGCLKFFGFSIKLIKIWKTPKKLNHTVDSSDN